MIWVCVSCAAGHWRGTGSWKGPLIQGWGFRQWCELPLCLGPQVSLEEWNQIVTCSHKLEFASHKHPKSTTVVLFSARLSSHSEMILFCTSYCSQPHAHVGEFGQILRCFSYTPEKVKNLCACSLSMLGKGLPCQRLILSPLPLLFICRQVLNRSGLLKQWSMLRLTLRYRQVFRGQF